VIDLSLMVLESAIERLEGDESGKIDGYSYKTYLRYTTY